ncbi:MAG: hypothetical protein ABI778_12155, partial [Ignavibacteriota bacterium]
MFYIGRNDNLCANVSTSLKQFLNQTTISPVNPLRKFRDSLNYYIKGIWNGMDSDHCFIFASGIAFSACSRHFRSSN